MKCDFYFQNTKNNECVELHWLQPELLHLCGHWLDEPVCYRQLGCLIEINAFAEHSQTASIYFSGAAITQLRVQIALPEHFYTSYFIHYFYYLFFYFQPELGIIWNVETGSVSKIYTYQVFWILYYNFPFLIYKTFFFSFRKKDGT